MSLITNIPLFVWKGGLAGFVKGFALTQVGNPIAHVIQARLERVPRNTISVVQAGLVVVSAAVAYRLSCTGDFDNDAGTLLTSLAGSILGSDYAQYAQPLIARTWRQIR